MISFKYQPLWDLVWMKRNKTNSNFLNDIGVEIIKFKPKNFLVICNLLFNLKPIKYKKDITVYFLSSGTTGAYTYPNKIFICPVNIEKFGGLHRVLSHELAHLELGEEVEKLTHDEKEKRVKELEGKILTELF